MGAVFYDAIAERAFHPMEERLIVNLEAKNLLHHPF